MNKKKIFFLKIIFFLKLKKFFFFRLCEGGELFDKILSLCKEGKTLSEEKVRIIFR